MSRVEASRRSGMGSGPQAGIPCNGVGPPLAGDRLATRLRHLARLIGRDPVMIAGRAS